MWHALENPATTEQTVLGFCLSLWLAETVVASLLSGTALLSWDTAEKFLFGTLFVIVSTLLFFGVAFLFGAPLFEYAGSSHFYTL